jgi:anti-sigma regulatory factor (Ser/Thr protein kinase)
VTPFLRRHRELRGSGAAAQARQEVRGIIDEALLAGLTVRRRDEEDALLVTCELVTNAVRHTRGPCSLDLAVRHDGIDIDVTDHSPEPPRPRAPDPSGALGGYGWLLVSRLADDLSVRPVDGDGKTVHAHICTA